MSKPKQIINKGKRPESKSPVKRTKPIQNKNIKRIDPKEFVKKGYLQELNRQFLHPLGLALEVIIRDGNYEIGGVWDFRNNPEGKLFHTVDKKQHKEKANLVQKELKAKAKVRKKRYGFVIQPINITH